MTNYRSNWGSLLPICCHRELPSWICTNCVQGVLNGNGWDPFLCIQVDFYGDLSPLTKKKALWQSQWRPCGKFAAALPQTHCKVAAVCFYHANEPSCRFAINLPQPCGKIIYVNYPLAKLRHSVTLHICFLAMLWHTNQFINIHWNLLANLRQALP